MLVAKRSMQKFSKIFAYRMMQGLEYILLHVQNPILFVIRKQHRHSPTQGDRIDAVENYCKTSIT